MQEMKELLATNIYDVCPRVLVCGTCLPSVEFEAFKQLRDSYSQVLTLCLEQTHVNIAITKLCAMVSTGKINELAFASVNNSPHCTQLHYIKHEIERVISKEKLPVMKNFVISKGNIYELTDKTIARSKDLILLNF